MTGRTRAAAVASRPPKAWAAGAFVEVPDDVTPRGGVEHIGPDDY